LEETSMKKNFLTVIAMTVVAFFVSAEIAKAADISFSGQVRTRWEVAEHLGNGGVAGAGSRADAFDNKADDFVMQSTRLAAKANINETTSAFIQMQSARTWGGAENVTDGGGSGNASAAANNVDASVGLHQAYFTIKNFMNLPMGWDAKVGRQEIKLDGWRLFGNTIWTTGMQTHDAVRLTHKHDNVTASLMYILRNEDGRENDPEDNDDFDVYAAHVNVKGVLGGQFSGYYVYSDNGCAPQAAKTTAGGRTCNNFSNDFHTIGGRQAGNIFGMKYRVEAYGQFGDATGIVNSTGATSHSSLTAGQQIDREAYMYGVRLTKAFNNVSFKPAITMWYDYLSGTSDDDLKNGNWSSFDTLYDTGHKYYGLQDLFLGVGGGGEKGTQGLGLQDLAVKAKLNPIAGWTLKVDYHYFWTAEGASNVHVSGNTNTVLAGDDGFLGNELDVTAIHKLNSGTKIIAGYSNFNAGQTFRRIRTTTTGASDANWAYVQFDVKF
jgi:hypothetical protein